MNHTIETKFEDRHLGIGGSDLDDLFEFSDYGCKRKLWYSKRQVPKDYENNRYELRRGKRLEKVAFDYFRQLFYANNPGFTGAIFHSSDDGVSSSFSLMGNPVVRVNIDGFIIEDPTRPQPAPIPIELKTLGVDSFTKYKKEGLPKGYCAQLQWAMGIVKSNHGWYGIYSPELDALEMFKVDFDESFYEPSVIYATETCSQIHSGISPLRRKPSEEEQNPRACMYCPWRKTCKGLGSNGKPLNVYQDLDLNNF